MVAVLHRLSTSPEGALVFPCPLLQARWLVQPPALTSSTAADDCPSSAQKQAAAALQRLAGPPRALLRQASARVRAGARRLHQLATARTAPGHGAWNIGRAVDAQLAAAAGSPALADADLAEASWLKAKEWFTVDLELSAEDEVRGSKGTASRACFLVANLGKSCMPEWPPAARSLVMLSPAGALSSAAGMLPGPGTSRLAHLHCRRQHFFILDSPPAAVCFLPAAPAAPGVGWRAVQRPPPPRHPQRPSLLLVRPHSPQHCPLHF